MKFFMIIGENVLYTYEEDVKKFELQLIEGSETYPYSPNSVEDDLQAYMEALSNEKNLGTTSKLEFDVLDCADEYSNSAVLGTLQKDKYIDKHYMLDKALEDVIKKLSRDKKLLIDEYGINYGRFSYKMVNGNVEKSEFDLLAYTIHSDDIVGLMNRN